MTWVRLEPVLAEELRREHDGTSMAGLNPGHLGTPTDHRTLCGTKDGNTATSQEQRSTH